MKGPTIQLIDALDILRYLRANFPDSSDNLATANFICGNYGDSQCCFEVSLTEPLMEYGILEVSHTFR